MNNRYSKLTFILILIFGLKVNRVSAQITSQEIDDIAERAMDNFTVAGVAVAVVKDGKIIHQKGYGVQSINRLNPISTNLNITDFINAETRAKKTLKNTFPLPWDLIIFID